MAPITLIQTFDYTRPRNVELAQLFLQLSSAIMPIDVLFLTPHITRFNTDITEFCNHIREAVASKTTRDMRPYEAERDRLITELFHAVRNGLASASPATRDAASFLDVELRRYGNPYHLPMNEKTRAVENIHRALTGPEMSPRLLQVPSAETALRQLADVNIRFAELFDDRTAEIDARVPGLTERLRITAEESTRVLMRKINAWLEVNEADRSLDPVVSLVNTILTEALHTLHRRGGEERPAPGAAAETVTAPGPVCGCAAEEEVNS